MKKKCVSLARTLLFNKILCAYTFCRNIYLKKSIKIRSFLIWRHHKECKIRVTFRAFNMNISSQLPLRSYLQEWSQKIIDLRSSHQDVFFKFFEKYLWWSTISRKFECNVFLLLTAGAEELYFIASFCWTATFVEDLSKAASMFWKSWGKF